MADEKTINEYNRAVARVRGYIREISQVDAGTLPEVIQAKYDLANTELASMEDSHLHRVNPEGFYALKNNLENAYHTSLSRSEADVADDEDDYRSETDDREENESRDRQQKLRDWNDKIEAAQDEDEWHQPRPGGQRAGQENQTPASPDNPGNRRDLQDLPPAQREEAIREWRRREAEAKRKEKERGRQKAAAKTAKKGWAKVFLQFLWTSLPWILLALAIAAVLMIIIFAILGAIRSGANGSTPNQPVNSASDATILKKTLIAGGDKEIGAEETDSTMAELQRNLSDLAGKTDDPAIKSRADETVQKINRFLLSHDPALGKEIIADIRAILPQIAEQIPKIEVPTRSPFDNAILGFNENLHYGTPLRPEVRTDNLEHGTYMYYGKGIADAVDLFVEQDSDVYPIFPGKIINISDDGTGNKKIVIQNGDYELLMAQIKIPDNIKEGQTVTASQSIGKVAEVEGFNEVHVELAYQGRPVVTTALDKIDYTANDQSNWGEYLWNHIKEAMNLQ